MWYYLGVTNAEEIPLATAVQLKTPDKKIETIPLPDGSYHFEILDVQDVEGRELKPGEPEWMGQPQWLWVNEVIEAKRGKIKTPTKHDDSGAVIPQSFRVGKYTSQKFSFGGVRNAASYDYLQYVLEATLFDELIKFYTVSGKFFDPSVAKGVRYLGNAKKKTAEAKYPTISSGAPLDEYDAHNREVIHGFLKIAYPTEYAGVWPDGVKAKDADSPW